MASAIPSVRATLFMVSSLVTIVLATSCASFHGGPLPKIKELPPRSSAKPSVMVKLTFFDWKPSKSPEKQRRKSEDLQEELVKVLRESGYFSSVGPDVSEPALLVDAGLWVESDAAITGELAGMTFGLVPEVETVKYWFEATVTSSHLSRDWIVHLEDSYENCMHLFLLPVMPFRPQSVVARAVRKNVYRHFAFELQDKGILDAVTSGGAAGSP